ncbi:MAG: hypothetical protein AB7Y46_03570 [Armatimonadota bacterium]
MTGDVLTRSYEDLSTDEGFQFRFHCQRCDAAFVSRFQPCPPETDEGLLAPVGELFTEAQQNGHEEHIVESAPEHETALRVAIAEAAEHLHQCPRCGEWVCADCWNPPMLMCRKCAPCEASHPLAAQ